LRAQDVPVSLRLDPASAHQVSPQMRDAAVAFLRDSGVAH